MSLQSQKRHLHNKDQENNNENTNERDAARRKKLDTDPDSRPHDEVQTRVGRGRVHTGARVGEWEACV